ncbi:MAG: glycosyltransferase family 2 protein [Sphaerochaetaceae bacterium]
MYTPLLSIVVINHNTKEMTTKTIDAIIHTTKNTIFEVIVVDNSSKQEEFFSYDDERVRTFLHVENKGFAHGCNYGVERSKGDLVLFLNSDTEVCESAIDKSVNCIVKDTHIGAVGIKTILRDGSFDAACKRGFPTPFASLSYFLGLEKKFPKSRIFGKYHLTYLSNTENCEVDAIAGAFLLMRKDLFQELGGFDEQFFMYGEDLDLCMKIKLSGHSILYLSDAIMIHYKRQSGLAQNNPKIIDAFYDSMKIFYNKYYKQKYPKFLTWLIMKSIDFRHHHTIRKQNT